MMATGTSRKCKRIILVPIQLSELFTYPNDNDFEDGQRGSDNRGWTVCYRAISPQYTAVRQEISRVSSRVSP